ENKGYNNEDFTKRLDEDLFPKMDGTPNSGPGGYTSQSIRASYDQRIKGKCSWDEIGTLADTTEAIERVLAIAIYYAKDPKAMAKNVWENTNVTQIDATVASITVAYSAVLSQLIIGEPFNSKLSVKLMDMVKDKKLPFHAVTTDSFKPPKLGVKEPNRDGVFSSPDALLTPMFITQAVEDESIKIEPAWKASLVYGMPCAIYHIVPAVYFLTATYKNNFENAVLHALNGGGQNMARAMLTGALVGAQVGIQGIPQRFIDGLTRKDEILKLAEGLTENL
ncbi:MAG: ADP-ribosylglycohydrolase family protein, partial [Thiovulaceae bacterium]|nr:ADP-ribosylglycohydrolase family protein [Sulfurimonadaceae bacterium]